MAIVTNEYQVRPGCDRREGVNGCVYMELTVMAIVTNEDQVRPGCDRREGVNGCGSGRRCMNLVGYTRCGPCRCMDHARCGYGSIR